jgi:CHAD domain-containing protein
MPSKKKLKHFIKKRLKHLKLHLYSYCQGGDAEQLHKLRVEIKKVKSVVRFVDDCTNSHLNKQLKPLKLIFEKAARIRNTHITLELCTTNGSKQFLARQQHLALSRYSQFAKEYETMRVQLEVLAARLPAELTTIAKRKSNKWSSKQFKKTENKLLAGALQYHNARKIIKRLLHINTMQPIKPTLNKNYLEQLERAIGNWHDLKITAAVAKRSQALTPKLKAQLKKEETRLLNEIEKGRQSFSQQVTAKK